MKKTFCVMCPKWEIKNPALCSNTLVKGRAKLHFCTRRCKEKYLKTE